MNGETLPAAHGFPVRLVAEDIYGSRWVKWVTEMQVD
ncbi:MAG: molybdopterin-dependent oxidoreductase [Spirochaetes bacterium]|nr:molybdopterin-dependent oxidoreductase [Spirochaetota bacterium]